MTANKRNRVRKRIFVPTTSGSDWQRLLGKPKLHWRRGYSAMSAAACWETNSPRLPPEIVGLLESVDDKTVHELELLLAIPEWEVELPGGDRPSQTDILAVCRNDHNLVILGVEAKVDEPFGPTLGERRTHASAGQRERIAYLEKELGCKSPLDNAIRYQLLHRTVSALLMARAFHASTGIMVVQSFSPERRWREDFDSFVKALNGQSLSADLFEIALADKPRLLVGWCTGAAEYLSAELPSTL